MYVRFPLSLRNVEALLNGQGIEISHETERSWWIRFGSMLVAQEIIIFLNQWLMAKRQFDASRVPSAKFFLQAHDLSCLRRVLRNNAVSGGP